MIMIIKKRKIMSFFTLILAVVSVVSIRDYYSSVTVSYVPSYKKVIVIDAGHGSPDGGAVGITNQSRCGGRVRTAGQAVLLWRPDLPPPSRAGCFPPDAGLEESLPRQMEKLEADL